MKRTHVISLSIAAALMVVPACGSLPRFEPVTLVGSSWTVSSYSTGEPEPRMPIDGSSLTAEFGEDGNVSGSSGCNSYSGTYEISGETVEFGEMISTLIACIEPEGIMEQEADFFNAMKNAERFQLQGDLLVLFDSQGNRLVEFEANK